MSACCMLTGELAILPIAGTCRDPYSYSSRYGSILAYRIVQGRIFILVLDMLYMYSYNVLVLLAGRISTIIPIV